MTQGMLAVEDSSCQYYNFESLSPSRKGACDENGRSGRYRIEVHVDAPAFPSSSSRSTSESASAACLPVSRDFLFIRCICHDHAHLCDDCGLSRARERGMAKRGMAKTRG